MERHSFRMVLMWELCVSAEFPHQEIWWNYGIFRSVEKEWRTCRFLFLSLRITFWACLFKSELQFIFNFIFFISMFYYFLFNFYFHIFLKWSFEAFSEASTSVTHWKCRYIMIKKFRIRGQITRQIVYIN